MSKAILAVDDSASMRQLVAFTLRNAGYEVVEAVDGQDALGKITDAVGLVLTDLNMPRMNGFDLIQKLRQSPAYKYVPIVFLTTESHDSKKQEAKAAGATGWIVKPFRPEQLLAVVKRVLG